ncbi:hypothetical protein MES4922_230175 [Mesorhizobium ventifaucium]|uniref:LysR family transcriptional regulator n=1 Tax=Mesorhizobium ventifaucium TaxID=666020 RepID=A0ABM9DTY8_9HYPH|nr:hypothetical protein MES4922_230175 [Mesorhizobium ventifaucium]
MLGHAQDLKCYSVLCASERTRGAVMSDRQLLTTGFRPVTTNDATIGLVWRNDDLDKVSERASFTLARFDFCRQP